MSCRFLKNLKKDENVRKDGLDDGIDGCVEEAVLNFQVCNCFGLKNRIRVDLVCGRSLFLSLSVCPPCCEESEGCVTSFF